MTFKVSADGRIYPCIRWLPYTQVDKAEFIDGTARDGFKSKENFLRVREGAYRSNAHSMRSTGHAMWRAPARTASGAATRSSANSEGR
jgi:hypothetical protein